MENVYVNIDELRQIAQDMKTKSNNIMDNYQNQVDSAITLGQEAIQISGLDTSKIKNSFSKIFTNLNTRINDLADFLINNVANEYDDISLAITNAFNDSFANELAGLLGITVGTGSVSKSNKSTSSTSSSSSSMSSETATKVNQNAVDTAAAEAREAAKSTTGDERLKILHEQNTSKYQTQYEGSDSTTTKTVLTPSQRGILAPDKQINTSL